MVACPTVHQETDGSCEVGVGSTKETKSMAESSAGPVCVCCPRRTGSTGQCSLSPSLYALVCM